LDKPSSSSSSKKNPLPPTPFDSRFVGIEPRLPRRRAQEVRCAHGLVARLTSTVLGNNVRRLADRIIRLEHVETREAEFF